MSSGSLFPGLVPPDQKVLSDFAKPKSQRLYQELVKLTIDACEGLLKDPRGKAIKAIVTGRVKKYDSLKKKLQDLTETTEFPSEWHLHEHPDMGDLAGIRIGLYFPDDVGVVATRIQEYFDEVHRFGSVTDTSRLPVQGRNLDVSKMGLGRWHTVNADGTVDYWAHSGYESWQMVLQWKERLPARLQELKPDRPPGVVSYKVEIQLGTVVTQAWAEVQHNIIYKKPAHILTTPSMKRMIDAVNGLAITTDIMLRELDLTLKRAEEEGLERGFRNFRDYKDLLAWVQSTYLSHLTPDKIAEWRNQNMDQAHVLTQLCRKADPPLWRFFCPAKMKLLIERNGVLNSRTTAIETLDIFEHIIGLMGFEKVEVGEGRSTYKRISFKPVGFEGLEKEA